MRPSIEEQLQGTCRVLEKVVAPCVTDPYARTILEGLIANLRMLTGALPAVPAFLAGDNRSTATLLKQLQAVVAPDLAKRIEEAVAQSDPDATDTRALGLRNCELRALFSSAVSGSELPPAMRAAALSHMSARAAAAPMRYVPTSSPTAKPT